MASPTPDRSAWTGRTLALLVGAYALVAGGLLAASGALVSDFSAFEDEPSHLMSALMLRDYLVGGLPGSPVAYAKDYYLHYPKVTIGHWPPLLPMALGAWTTVFGASHAGILSFFAALATGIATAVHLGVRRFAGDGLAALAGLAFLLVPQVQRFGHMTMTELPLAFCCTLAVLSFGRFLDGGRARDSAFFALFAVAGILIKGSAVFLALVPPIAIVLGGRWSLLKRPALWMAPAIVAALTAPWYLATIDVSTSSWVGGPGPNPEHALRALRFYPLAVLWIAGPVAGGLALVGAAAALAGPLRRGTWAARIAWVPSLITCHALVPTGPQARHMILLVPVWLMLAAFGARFLVERLPRLALGRAHLAPLALALSLAPFLAIERKDCTGYADAARAVLADPSLAEAVLLIDSDSRGEGGFVAAVALNEERPGHIVLRGSKVLAQSDWMGLRVESLFEDAASMHAYLASIPVEIVAIDGSTDPERLFEYDHMLRDVVADRTDAWTLFGRFDLVRDGRRFPGGLALYRQTVEPGRPRKQLRFDDVVGRSLPGSH